MTPGAFDENDEARCPHAAGSDRKKLQAHILSLSRDPSWSVALLEWTPLGLVDESGDCDHCGLSTCPCGYHPIKDRCWIANEVTKAETFVGNVCIHRFMEGNEKLRAWRLVRAGLKRITLDLDAAPNAALIAFAADRGWLKSRTHVFLLDTRRKRNLSDAQRAYRRDTNTKLIKATLRRRPKATR